MGRNNADFTGGRHSGGSSNPKNWGNEDDHKSAKPVKYKPDMDMPDYADYYEERNT